LGWLGQNLRSFGRLAPNIQTTIAICLTHRIRRASQTVASPQPTQPRRDFIDAISSKPLRGKRLASHATIILALVAYSLFLAGLCSAQTPAGALPSIAALPEAPEPQTTAASPTPKLKPCPSPGSTHPTPPDAGAKSAVAQVGQQPDPGPCKVTWANRYDKFVNGPQDKPLTPKDKAWLAARNVADPFNNVTILG